MNDMVLSARTMRQIEALPRKDRRLVENLVNSLSMEHEKEKKGICKKGLNVTKLLNLYCAK